MRIVVEILRETASSRRGRQDEAKPVDTGPPGSADIMSAARPMPITSWEASQVAAAVTCGPQPVGPQPVGPRRTPAGRAAVVT